MSESSHSVVDGVLCKTSVSQITTFDRETFGGCPRKWYFEKVLRLERPSTKSQNIGTDTHSQIEHYLGTGEDVLGPIARAGRHFMPESKVFLKLEAPLVQLAAAGVPLRGFIDCINESGVYTDNEGENHDEDFPEVIDWKTTSDMSYAKTGLELANTVQMVGYAKDVMDSLAADTVRLSHGYFRTRGMPYAEKRSVLISRDAVDTKWNRVNSVVEEMKQVAAVQRIEDVPANYGACDAYGGCPFQKQCPKEPGSIWERLGVKGGGKPMASLLDMFTKPVPVMGVVVPANGPKPGVVRAVGIVPPDAPVSGPPTSAEPIPPETLLTMSPEIQAAAKPFAVEVPQVIQNVTTNVETAAPATESPVLADPENAATKGKKRGRPAGSKNVPKVIEESVSKAVEVNMAGEGTPTPEAAPVIEPPKGMSLYVDVISEGLDLTSLEDYINDTLRQMEKEFDVVDIRIAPEKSPLAYAKWKGALAGIVRANPPPANTYHVLDVRESELKQVIVEALRPLCLVYCRGR